LTSVIYVLVSKITPRFAEFFKQAGLGRWFRCKIRGLSVSVDQNIGNSWVLHRTVVLVGMMGSGKTAIGRTLAQVLDVPYVDSDAEIESAANATIAEIFDKSGESFFRDREAEVIARLLQSRPCILSTGGGAYLAQRNRAAISDHGVAVWLDADLDLLWERVRHKDTRPLLRTANPKATLAALFEDRNPIYSLAGLKIRVDASASIPQTTQSVVDVLATRPDILETS
jgi:shikimate kinase